MRLSRIQSLGSNETNFPQKTETVLTAGSLEEVLIKEHRVQISLEDKETILQQQKSHRLCPQKWIRLRKRTYRLLTVGLDGPHVSSADPHQAVQRPPFTVQTRAVGLDLSATVEYDLWAQGEVLHQHPPVVHHLALTLSTHDST